MKPLNEFEVGDVKVKGGIKSIVTDVDPNTGAVSWDVEYAADYLKLYQQVQQLFKTVDKAARQSNAEPFIKDWGKDVRQLRNSLRTYLRNNKAEEYARVKNMHEMSITGGSASASTGTGAQFATTKAFKKEKQIKENIDSEIVAYIKANPIPSDVEEGLLTEGAGSALFILWMIMKGSTGAGLVASPIAGLIEYFFHELPEKRLKAKMLKLFKDPSKRQEVLDMAKEVESYLSPGQQRYLKGLVNGIGTKKIENEISQAYIDINDYIVNKDRMIKSGEWEDYLKREKELADRRRADIAKAKAKKEKDVNETNLGSSLGLGPKASENGVKDNAYVKQFKYKLVDPKKLAKQSKAIDTKYLWAPDTFVKE